MSAWVNGRRARLIGVRDRGLQYGDGVFETMRVRVRAVRLLDFHMARLREGCRRLAIDLPAEPRLRRELERIASRRSSAVLKLIVTRGVGPRGYRPSGQERCTRIVLLDALPRSASRREGAPVRVRVCATRLAINRRLAGLKTLNRLEQVLARSEWSDPGIHEGLMLDEDEYVVCGTMSNVFLRRGRLLVTPMLDRCGVAGVMRRWVLEQAAGLELRAVERRMRVADFLRADEVFMTNAVAGVMPVSEIRVGRARSRPPQCTMAMRLGARLATL